jgi:hypothetical protein
VRRVIRNDLDEGIVLFNRRQFFEAHEVWEDGWRRAQGDEQTLLHGLIQVAAGFHKLQCEQPSGTASLLTKAAGKLAAIPEDFLDLDLRPLRASVETWKETATRSAELRTTGYDASSLPLLPAPRRRLFERRLHSQIEIEAPSRRVWDVLADFPAYREWNPFIVKIEGEARAGDHLTVEIRPPGRRGMTFRPTVLVVDSHRELRWLGRMVFPGLFDSEHVFTIAPFSAERVRFSQRETFRGLLVPVMSRALWEVTSRGFEEMNRALKRRAEGR